jgi:hypothetical protein
MPAGSLKASRQHGGVLDRLHRTLCHVGQHCGCCIPQQGEPGRPSIASMDRGRRVPTIGRVGGADNRVDLRMPSIKLKHWIGHYAPRRP